MVDELVYWLVLHRIRGLGPRRFSELINQVGSLSNCFSGRTPRRDFLKWCQEKGIVPFAPDWVGAEQDLNWANQAYHHILTWQTATYPPQLKEIPQSPPVLFVRGQLKVLNCPQIAIVGSRTPTAEGKENAYHFGSRLAQHGLTITSGLAIGIDAASHQGAIAANGSTVAVLGNGLDRIYPPKHQNLAAQILQTEGALVSEFPIGTPPKPENFPQRNRIISGLSLGVLVVESAIKSGSLITANYALDQGREVFTLPGSIHNPMVKGNHQLIRQGAKCVEDLEHILEEFPQMGKKLMPKKHPKVDEKADAKTQFLTHVETECTPLNAMVDSSGLSVTEVSSMLFVLEMEGRVRAVPGGYIRVQG